MEKESGSNGGREILALLVLPVHPHLHTYSLLSLSLSLLLSLSLSLAPSLSPSLSFLSFLPASSNRGVELETSTLWEGPSLGRVLEGSLSPCEQGTTGLCLMVPSLCRPGSGIEGGGLFQVCPISGPGQASIRWRMGQKPPAQVSGSYFQTGEPLLGICACYWVPCV